MDEIGIIYIALIAIFFAIAIGYAIGEAFELNRRNKNDNDDDNF